MTPEPPTRDTVIADFGAWLADTVDALDALPPRVAAERSNGVRSGTHTVDEVEAAIRAARGLPAVDRSAGAA